MVPPQTLQGPSFTSADVFPAPFKPFLNFSVSLRSGIPLKPSPGWRWGTCSGHGIGPIGISDELSEGATNNTADRINDSSPYSHFDPGGNNFLRTVNSSFSALPLGASVFTNCHQRKEGQRDGAYIIQSFLQIALNTRSRRHRERNLCQNFAAIMPSPLEPPEQFDKGD